MNFQFSLFKIEFLVSWSDEAVQAQETYYLFVKLIIEEFAKLRAFRAFCVFASYTLSRLTRFRVLKALRIFGPYLPALRALFTHL